MGYEPVNNFIELKDLNKSYEKKNGKTKSLPVLKNINLTIGRNEFVTILGPSGCGKSTLLKLIGGFLTPDSGQINKDRQKVCEPGLDRIMVFQEFSQLFPWKTVIENVVFSLKAANKENKFDYRAAAADYLKKVNLEEYLNYYPHQLSGGMKQRTALARTFAARSEVLLMDEPFGSLDSLTRHSLQSLLMEIWRQEQQTVIFVTHDIRESIFLSDRIVLMSSEPGQIEEIIENNIERPRDRTGLEFSNLYKEIYEKMANKI